MGFWEEIKNGLGVMFGTIGAVLEFGVGIGAGIIEGAAGGPVAAAIGGFMGAVSGASTLVDRISSYFHPLNADTGLPDHSTVQSIINPINKIKTSYDALSSVSASSPPSALSLASTGAKLQDGIAKHSSVVSAVAEAGGSPVAKHFAHAVSNTIVNAVSARTGFNARNAIRFGNSSMREAQMLPTTSAYYTPIHDYLLHTGPEVVGMNYLNKNAGASRTQDITMSASGGASVGGAA